MDPHVDYDAIADAFDRRYERSNYTGVKQTLGDFVGRDTTRRILDVGCGTGYWLEWLAARGFNGLAGLDASSHMLAVAAARSTGADLRLGRARELPWSSGSFDRVVCVNALHHFGDKRAFVAEAHRVLTPHGGLISFGLDPHVGTDRWFVYDLFDGTLATDLRRYPPASTVRAWLTAAGFARTATFVAMHRPGRVPARDALARGYLDRASTSQLTLLSDAVYRAGISRIEQQIRLAEHHGETYQLESDLRVYATVGWRSTTASRPAA